MLADVPYFTPEESTMDETVTVEMDPVKAAKLLNILSAFKTFKKPEKLPDRFRFSSKTLEGIKRWKKMAKRKLKKGTFTSLTQLANYLPFKEDEEDTRMQAEGDKGTEIEIEEAMTDIGDDFYVSFFDPRTNPDDSDWESDLDRDADIYSIISESDFYSRDADFEEIRDVEAEYNIQPETNSSISDMLPEMTQIFSKDFLFLPFKAGLEAFETYMEAHPDLGEEELGHRKHQLELYQKIVAVYNSMDTETNLLQQAVAVKTFMGQLSTSGRPPSEVESAQNAAMTMALPQMLTSLVGTYLSGISTVIGPRPGTENDGTAQEGRQDNCTIL